MIDSGDQNKPNLNKCYKDVIYLHALTALFIYMSLCCQLT